jgi:magnesium transporter
VVDPTDDDLGCIQEQFSLHPLAIEDVRKHQQRPKLEEYPEHAFVVTYSGDLQEVDFFVGPRWLVTVRERDDDGRVWDDAGARARFERLTPEDARVGFLLYVLLDELVDGYFAAAEATEDLIESLEDRIFTEEQQVREERSVQEELFRARRRLLTYRRTITPMREVVTSLLRGETKLVDDATRIQLQDVYDHVLRVVDQLDAARELMGNAVDAHLAIISNQMNKVMKRMTSWGAILLGSTLVAGIEGMNFAHMPELRWYYGYPLALAAMVVITVVLYRFFKVRDWL